MGDTYDQKDAKGFIQILGLPARTRARLMQQTAANEAVANEVSKSSETKAATRSSAATEAVR